MGKNKTDILWLPSPEEHNYPAAVSYLTLVFGSEKASQLVAALKSAPITSSKAKDIFRASGLSLFGVSNSHVKKDLKKIKKGIPLSPLLLVGYPQTGRVIIADGYHRLCGVYAVHEDSWIDHQIVNYEDVLL